MNVTMTRRAFLGATSCTVAFVGARLGGEAPSKTEITFLNPVCTDGGAGLAVVLRAPSGKTYLFDTGNGITPERSNGATIVVPWLKAHGIREIDGLVISHYHEDHFGGFLSMSDFPIKRIFNNNYLPKDPNGKPLHVGEALFVKMLADWEKKHPGQLVNDAREGTELEWNEPGFEAELVWPPRDRYVEPLKDRKGYAKQDGISHHLLNGNSNSLRVKIGDKLFFLMGDIQPDYVKTFMRPHLERQGKWGCDVCSLPAHGTNKDAAMVEIATMSPKPKIVIASLGNRPWMMNCGRGCVESYGEAGYRAYSTNVHGDVTVTFAGVEPTVSTDPSKVFPVEES